MPPALLLVLPLVIPLFSAVLCLIFRRKIKVQEYINIFGTSAFLGVAVHLLYSTIEQGVLAVQIGNWQAPFGITMVSDMLAALMVLITAIIGFAIAFYALQDVDLRRKAFGFFPAFQFLLLGVNGAFLTGDAFNLYVWYEVMLLASFVVIALGNSKSQLEGALKYVILNFVGSGFFLTGIGVLYNATGTLNMAALAELVRNDPDSGMITLASIFFFISFGVKSAIFPLFSWLPSSYHTPPVSVSGLMAGLLTKVGVYSFIRFFSLVFISDVGFTHTLLLWAAGLTMLSGILGAMAHNEFRKILSFHIISQIGYMIMGLAIFTPLALAASIFYVIHHILVKTNLFLISGLVNTTNGSFLLKKLGGVYERYPLIAVLFIISAFSLAGIPPLSGFWGKFTLVQAGIANGLITIVVIALVVGLFTLYSMTKIWGEAFWKADPYQDDDQPKLTQWHLIKAKYLMVLPVIFLACLTLFLSLNPDFLVDLSLQASDQLKNPEAYIKTVLENDQSRY